MPCPFLPSPVCRSQERRIGGGEEKAGICSSCLSRRGREKGGGWEAYLLAGIHGSIGKPALERLEEGKEQLMYVLSAHGGND